MKMPWTLLGFAGVLCALAACKDQPVAPRADAQTVAGPMAADFTNNPTAGPRIQWRGDAGDMSVVLADGRYLVAFWATDVSLDRCGHAYPPTHMVGQWQGDPEGGPAHWLVKAKAVNAYLIDLTGPVDCVRPAGAGKFVGWSEDANVSTNDNAAGVNPWDVTRTDSYGGNAEAIFTTPEGRKIHVTLIFHHTWHPDDPAPRDNVHFNVGQ